MASETPFEILYGPLELYTSALGVAFPDIAAAPSGSWTLLGLSGSKNYKEDGVTVRHPQTIERDNFRMLGSMGPRKAARTQEDLEIEAVVSDLRASVYAKALDLAKAVTQTAAGSGTGGNKNFTILRGPRVGQLQLLVRGSTSPEAAAVSDTYNAQWEVPIVIQAGEPETVWVKDTPVGLQFMFSAMEHPSLGFGTVRLQDAAAA